MAELRIQTMKDYIRAAEDADQMHLLSMKEQIITAFNTALMTAAKDRVSSFEFHVYMNNVKCKAWLINQLELAEFKWTIDSHTYGLIIILKDSNYEFNSNI